MPSFYPLRLASIGAIKKSLGTGSAYSNVWYGISDKSPMIYVDDHFCYSCRQAAAEPHGPCGEPV
jgi:hypothetical protein